MFSCYLHVSIRKSSHSSGDIDVSLIFVSGWSSKKKKKVFQFVTIPTTLFIVNNQNFENQTSGNKRND